MLIGQCFWWLALFAGRNIPRVARERSEAMCALSLQASRCQKYFDELTGRFSQCPCDLYIEMTRLEVFQKFLWSEDSMSFLFFSLSQFYHPSWLFKRCSMYLCFSCRYYDRSYSQGFWKNVLYSHRSVCSNQQPAHGIAAGSLWNYI